MERSLTLLLTNFLVCLLEILIIHHLIIQYYKVKRLIEMFLAKELCILTHKYILLYSFKTLMWSNNHFQIPPQGFSYIHLKYGPLTIPINLITKAYFILPKQLHVNEEILASIYIQYDKA